MPDVNPFQAFTWPEWTVPLYQGNWTQAGSVTIVDGADIIRDFAWGPSIIWKLYIGFMVLFWSSKNWSLNHNDTEVLSQSSHSDYLKQDLCAAQICRSGTQTWHFMHPLMLVWAPIIFYCRVIFPWTAWDSDGPHSYMPAVTVHRIAMNDLF